MVPEDAAGKELGRDAVLLTVPVRVATVGVVVTVGAVTEVIVVGGKVRDGRPAQRLLKSEAPNDAVSY